MKHVLPVVLVAAAIARVVPAAAQEADDFDRFALGAYASAGMAHSFRELKGRDEDTKPRFAGGGGAYFDYYLTGIFALEGGVGFVGKGCRRHLYDGELDAGEDRWYRYVHMEVPFGVKLNLDNFRIGVAIALSVAIYGKTVYRGDLEGNFTSDYHWDYDYRRINLCPRVTFGYAIPLGPIAIVAGVAWSIEAINGFNDHPGVADGDRVWRNMNLMFDLGVEYGFS